MDLQQALFLLGRHRVDRAYIIDHSHIVLDALDSSLQAGRRAFALIHDLNGGFPNALCRGFELKFLVDKRHSFFHHKSVGLELTVFFHEIRGLHTMIALEDGHHRIFAHLRNRDDLQHMRHHAGREQIVCLGFCHFIVFLREQDQAPVVLVGCLNKFETAFLGHCNRHQHIRKQHRVLDRQHVEVGFHMFFVLAIFVLAIHFLEQYFFYIFIFFHIHYNRVFLNYAILHNADYAQIRIVLSNILVQ